MRSFRKWMESNADYDQALHRSQTLSSRFNPEKRAEYSPGEMQQDPMYSTLHKRKKPQPGKKNPVDALFGFMDKYR